MSVVLPSPSRKSAFAVFQKVVKNGLLLSLCLFSISKNKLFNYNKKSFQPIKNALNVHYLPHISPKLYFEEEEELYLTKQIIYNIWLQCTE